MKRKFEETKKEEEPSTRCEKLECLNLPDGGYERQVRCSEYCDRTCAKSDIETEGWFPWFLRSIIDHSVLSDEGTLYHIIPDEIEIGGRVLIFPKKNIVKIVRGFETTQYPLDIDWLSKLMCNSYHFTTEQVAFDIYYHLDKHLVSMYPQLWFGDIPLSHLFNPTLENYKPFDLRVSFGSRYPSGTRYRW